MGGQLVADASAHPETAPARREDAIRPGLINAMGIQSIPGSLALHTPEPETQDQRMNVQKLASHQMDHALRASMLSHGFLRLPL